jgi:3-deoxy-D-manno-octulosonic-acid transferase
MSLLRSGYYGLSWVCAPLISGYLAWRAGKGHEDKIRIQERFGTSKIARPDKPLLWVNAVSVGEAVAALTIIDAILKEYPRIHVLLTTTTPTSAKVVGARLPKNVTHQYSPVDTPQAVNRFLNHWQPDLAIWIESELWPNLLHGTQARAIPTVLLNGRMSGKSYANWKKLKSMISPLLSRLELCAVQSEEQATYFRALGAENISVMGNAKLLMSPLGGVDVKKYEDFKKEIGERPLWLAASTQPGEDESILKAHKNLQKLFPNLLTILVPRHIERGPSIQNLASAEGIKASLRTETKSLKDVELYIGDTLGELGVFFALSPVVFMGATFVPKGGHNPIEAAQMGAYVLHGIHTFNNPQLYDTLATLKLSQVVADENKLSSYVALWLKNKKETYEEPSPLAKYREKGLKDLITLLNPYLSSLREVRE